MTEKLKECPFCGCDPVMKESDPEFGEINYQVICECCKGNIFISKQEAIKTWNTRCQPRCGDCTGTGKVYCPIRYSFEIMQGKKLSNNFYCSMFLRKDDE